MPFVGQKVAPGGSGVGRLPPVSRVFRPSVVEVSPPRPSRLPDAPPAGRMPLFGTGEALAARPAGAGRPSAGLKRRESGDAVLTAPETRSSSPVRVLRGEDMQSPGLIGLYPCGEGAGYAGGIVSAAVDGIRCAQEAAK